jgi:hypothetical protein
VRRSDTEFDPYIDVVIEYDDQNATASAYALRCERDAPTRWREASGPTIVTKPEAPIGGAVEAGVAAPTERDAYACNEPMRVSGNQVKEEGS